MGTFTKYKSGTITSISADGTTLGFTLDDSAVLNTTGDGEAGRIVYITSGTDVSQGRYRRIESNTATSITLVAGFATSSSTGKVGPFRGLDSLIDGQDNYNATNERPVAATDTFTISGTLEEQITDPQLDTLIGVYNGYGTNGVIEIPAGVVIYEESATFEYNYRTHVDLQVGGAMIFGRQNLGDTSDPDLVGFPSHSCTLIDSSDGAIDGMNDRGAFHVNGGSLSCRTTHNPFYRFYKEATDTDDNIEYRQSFRMWNVNLPGNFGGRVSGDYSVFLGNTNNGNVSALGMLNPLSMSVFQDNVAKGSAQVVYLRPQLSGDTTANGVSVQDIRGVTGTAGRVFYLHGGGTTTDSTQSFVNWDFDELEATTTGDYSATYLVLQTAIGANHTVEFLKDFKLDFTEADGSAILEDDAAVEIHDSSDTAITTASTNGSVDAQRLKAYDGVLSGNAIADRINNFTDLTSYLNYEWAALYRNYSLLSGTTDLASPVGAQQVTLPRLPDNNITESNIGLVNAYTTLETAERLYDHQFLYKENNMDLPTLTTIGFTKSGDVLTVSPADADVTFSSIVLTPISYTAALGWIINPSTGGYTGGIETTGDINFDNTIQGEATATNLNFGATPPTQLINTTEAVSGTITLPTGSYSIDNADVSALNLAAEAGATVTIAVSNTTGSFLSVGTGVTTAEAQTLRLNLGETYDADNLRVEDYYESADGITFAATAGIATVDADDDNIINILFSTTPGSSNYYAISYLGKKIIAGNISGPLTERTLEDETNVMDTISFDAADTAFRDLAVIVDDGTTDVDPTIDNVTDNVDITISAVAGTLASTFTIEQTKHWLRYEVLESDDYIAALARGYIGDDGFEFNPFTTEVSDDLAGRLNINKATNAPITRMECPLVNGTTDLANTVSSTLPSNEIRFTVNPTAAAPSDVDALIKTNLNERLLTETNVVRLGKLQTVNQ